jgi:NTE family protein
MAQVGLVLGAGGLVGHAYHAGTLRALAQHGWDARDAVVVVGTSAGSGVAALLRAGLPPADFAARILHEPLSPEGARVVAGAPRPATGYPLRHRADGFPMPAAPDGLLRAMVHPWRLRPGHLMAMGAPAGTQPTAMIGDRVRAVYQGLGRWPEAPMWLCALRLDDSRRVVFGRDPAPEPDVATAVEASSAIPGVFAPVEIDGERYVDGGAHSPTNADLLYAVGLDVIVVVSPMSIRAGMPLRAATASRWWAHRLLHHELHAAKRAGVRLLVIEPGPADLDAMGLGVQAMDGTRMNPVTRQAEHSAASLLAGEAPLG